MDAIVYTSNSGFTAEYARLLGSQLKLPVFSLKEASKDLKSGAEVLYLGWLMAGQIKGFKQAAQRYRVPLVCGVGMGACGMQVEEARKANAIPADSALFTLQGGFDMKRLHGVYRLMMGMMKNTLGKKLAEKPDQTADEADMLDLLQNGGNRVSAENLQPILDFYRKNR